MILIITALILFSIAFYLFLDLSFNQKSEIRRYNLYPEKDFMKKDPNRVVVSLQELSKIWLKYNTSEQSVISDSTEKANEKVEERINVTDSMIETFINKTINPYLNEINTQKAKGLIEELLRFLTIHGNVPSVVLAGGDRELGDLYSVKDNLAKVTLKEHTIHVANEMVELVNKTYQEPRNVIPSAIVVSLAHDIGKVPEFHTGQYNTYEHPLISEIIFAQIVDELEEKPAWIDHIRKVIREHHIPQVKDQLCQLLKEADRKARLIELVKTTSGYKPASFAQWFDVKEFLQLIVKYINITQMDKWHAITYKGTVYVRPEFLYKTADSLRHQKKVLDLLFIYGSDTQLALQEIVKALRSISAISPILKEGYVSQKFKVTTKSMQQLGKSSQQVFTPLRLDVISQVTGISISEIERRKEGILEVLEILPT